MLSFFAVRGRKLFRGCGEVVALRVSLSVLAGAHLDVCHDDAPLNIHGSGDSREIVAEYRTTQGHEGACRIVVQLAVPADEPVGQRVLGSRGRGVVHTLDVDAVCVGSAGLLRAFLGGPVRRSDENVAGTICEPGFFFDDNFAVFPWGGGQCFLVLSKFH